MHPVLFHIGSLLIPSTALWRRWAFCWRWCWRSARRAWSASIPARCGISASSRSLRRSWARGCCWWRSIGAILRSHPLVDARAGDGSSSAARRCRALMAARGCARLRAHAAAAACRNRRRTRRPAGLGLAFEQWARCWPEPATAPSAPRSLGGHLHQSACARWSGTPLGVPLHPVQAYAALGFSRSRSFSAAWLPHRRQPAMLPACGLMGAGRRYLPHRNLARSGRAGRHPCSGALDGPQIAHRVCAGRSIRPARARAQSASPTLADRAVARRRHDNREAIAWLRLRLHIDVATEARGQRLDQFPRLATRWREPFARAASNRPGRRTGRRQACQSLAQAARRRAHRHHRRTASRSAQSHGRGHSARRGL